MFGGGQQTKGKVLTEEMAKLGLVTKEDLDKWYPGEGYLKGSPKEEAQKKFGKIFQRMGTKGKKAHPLGKKWGEVSKRIGKKSEEEWQGMGMYEGIPAVMHPTDPQPVKTKKTEEDWFDFLKGYNP